VRDLSDEESNGSDSEPSEGNLEEEQLVELIPKKLAKHRFIKGVEEEKKKPEPPKEPEKKIPVKKSKTTMQACMTSQKEKREKSVGQGTAKKVQQRETMFRQIVTKVKAGGRHRDVGTQIRYLGDGKTLSLMEIDILRHTGCKWSRIIFPGFKGNSKPFSDRLELYRVADKFEREG
jgi:hypothetical protein